ncbi:MAG: BspA family leucine-rich repeat surface protein [Xanthomonadales bacterium]|nr:BspA family leucine-rich repeat surface protein [Xanthomonadales bacterium]
MQALPSDDFVTTWKTDNPGRTNNSSVEILMSGGPYDVDWNNDGVFDQFNLVGPITHDYGMAGTYTIRIRGSHSFIFFRAVGDNEKILSLDQWGTNSWVSMNLAFYQAINLKVLAVDIPDFSAVTDMSVMFMGALLANPDTSNWNTSAVTDMNLMFVNATSANPDTSGWDTSAAVSMSKMFQGAISANPDTSGWDTSAVVSMSRMFQGATSANPDTSGWDTSSVINMSYMFQGATSANPDTSGWDTSSVADMAGMFAGATAFNRDIGSWNVTSLRHAEYMFAGIALSTANYESLLVGWNAQALQSRVFFSGGYSRYCSDEADAARTNMWVSYRWSITDSGRRFCPPATPVVAPDLTPATDTGVSNSDDITANSSPEFAVVCSAIGNTINLYTNLPAENTAIGTHVCTSVGAEIAVTTVVLIDSTHTISYVDHQNGVPSGQSPSLAVTIDTIVTAGPGSLTAPGSPSNDANADIIGSCGPEASNDTVVVTTTSSGGFTTLYNTPITLDASGRFSIVNPNWSEGAFTLHFECSDVAGNTAILGPFGPILIDTSCSGSDIIVSGDFPAGMHLCAGTNSLITSGNVNLQAGAVVYFQSPEITLNNGFNVSEGASLISSTVVGPVVPLLLGPTEIKASVGEILMFSESHICEDYEDGILAITPVDTGVITESTEPEIFTLSCTGLDGMQTQMEVRVITE